MDERTRRYVARLDAARARSRAEQLEDDVAAYRGLTPAERAHTVESVCRSAWQILKSRPDFKRALEVRDPPAPDFDQVWRGLMARRRAEVARER